MSLFMSEDERLKGNIFINNKKKDKDNKTTFGTPYTWDPLAKVAPHKKPYKKHTETKGLEHKQEKAKSENE